MFYNILPNQGIRNALMAYLKHYGIMAVFHFVPLHSSPMGQKFGGQVGALSITEELSGRLLRLPFYYEMTEGEQVYIVKTLNEGLGEIRVGKGIHSVLQAIS
jgi:dTDP-4-amino-4,6-dideoxygalactose transaminase